MRKVTVLLAMLAIVAMTSAPSYGTMRKYYKGGSIGPNEGSFFYDSGTATDWGEWDDTVPGWTGSTYPVPVAYESIDIRGGATCHIWGNITNAGAFTLGYWEGQPQYNPGDGHVIVEPDPTSGHEPIISVDTNNGMWVGKFTRWGAGFTPSTFTQTCGSVTTNELSLGVSHPTVDGGAAGYGKYVISGGTLNVPAFGIYAGWRHSSDPLAEGTGNSTFRIEGDSGTINVARYIQNSISKLEVVLTSSGTVTPISCTPTNYGYQYSTLKGTLDLDSSANTPTVGDRITIVEVLDSLGATFTAADMLDYSELTLIGVSALDRTINPAITQGYRLLPEEYDAVEDDAFLKVIYTALGDANLDASVTGADYTLYSAGYGVGDSWEEGDFNGDGAVTGADYTLYSAAYGTTPPGTIPEPITLTLLGLGGLALLKRRRQ